MPMSDSKPRPIKNVVMIAITPNTSSNKRRVRIRLLITRMPVPAPKLISAHMLARTAFLAGSEASGALARSAVSTCEAVASSLVWPGGMESVT
jgi:hypothetical protein